MKLFSLRIISVSSDSASSVWHHYYKPAGSPCMITSLFMHPHLGRGDNPSRPGRHWPSALVNTNAGWGFHQCLPHLRRSIINLAALSYVSFITFRHRDCLIWAIWNLWYVSALADLPFSSGCLLRTVIPFPQTRPLAVWSVILGLTLLSFIFVSRTLPFILFGLGRCSTVSSCERLSPSCTGNAHRDSMTDLSQLLQFKFVSTFLKQNKTKQNKTHILSQGGSGKNMETNIYGA